MPQSVTDLIDKAGKKVGSEYKLAKLFGVPRQRVSNWKTGTATCVPEDRALLAAAAGEDAVQELVRATLEKHAGTPKGDQLMRVLGKLSRQTGEAIGIVLPALASLSYGISYLTRCIFRASYNPWNVKLPLPIRQQQILLREI